MKKTIAIIAAALILSACCNKSNEMNDNQLTKEDAVIETLMTRRSVRAYKPEPVQRELMDKILEVGINAPSGMNRQPWELRVVDNEEYLKGITELQKENMDPNAPHNPFADPNLRNIFRNAPTVVFIAYTPGLCSQVDCGLLAGNLVNTAWAYGIGSCIQMGPVQFMKSEIAKPYVEKLGFSEGYELLMAIGFGYPDETPEAKPRDASKIQYVD